MHLNENHKFNFFDKLQILYLNILRKIKFDNILPQTDNNCSAKIIPMVKTNKDFLGITTCTN